MREKLALLAALLLIGCKPDLGRACKSLADKGVVRECALAALSPIRKEHHVVEQWDFREPGAGVGYGSLIRYDGSTYFQKESSDTAFIAKELTGFHYENVDELVQLETRFPVDSAAQNSVVMVVDDL